MLSVWTNTSYAKLLAITGLESMETRMIILREKFRLRFDNMKEADNSFLEKIL